MCVGVRSRLYLRVRLPQHQQITLQEAGALAVGVGFGAVAAALPELNGGLNEQWVEVELIVPRLSGGRGGDGV